MRKALIKALLFATIQIYATPVPQSNNGGSSALDLKLAVLGIDTNACKQACIINPFSSAQFITPQVIYGSKFCYNF